jgi:protein CMS1
MSNPKKRAAADDVAPSSKKAKKKKSKANSQDDETLDTELGLNTLFARLDNQLLADYLAQKTTRFGSDLSPVEIADLALPGRTFPSFPPLFPFLLFFLGIGFAVVANLLLLAGCIRDTSSWRSDRTLSNLPNFIEKFSEDTESLRKPPAAKGAPHTLIVAGAGLRAADLVR